jgi:hypothetical protein
MRINVKLYVLTLVGLGVLSILSSCSEKSPDQSNVPPIDTTGISTSGTMRFEGEIISVPSPIQVATLIQKNKISFNQDLVNNIQNRSKYLNETKKALNLGIYGTDLAYIANYNLGQINNDYFDALAGISSELGILDNIDKKLVTKLNSNLSNRDSILNLNADFFRSADQYLKSNNRPHISSCILIGGWIESLHLTANASTNNTELQSRLGEQKYSSRSMLRLAQNMDDPTFNPVKGEMEKLCELLDKLESTYTYRQPINDQREKITYLRSQTSVKMSNEELEEINQQINVVRNIIIE